MENVTLEKIEEAEQELVTDFDEQRYKAYDEILRDNVLAQDPNTIRERYRWIGFEIWRLGDTEFQRILATPFDEMHLHGIFPGADRIWQLLYMRISGVITTPLLPTLLRVTDLHQGFAPPKTNRGDNFFGVSYEMLLDASAPESFLQPKPLHQYWVKCDFMPEFFRGCWIPELLMRTYPPYIKELNRIRRATIDTLVQEAINGCNKRLSLLGSAVVIPSIVVGEEPNDQADIITTATPPPHPPGDPIKLAVQLWENIDLVELQMQQWRKKCHNILACLLRKRPPVTEAELFETLDGDPLVVIGSFLAAMEQPDRAPATIKQVIDKKLSIGLHNQPGVTCSVSGFPRAVWLPVALFAWIAARECRCGVISPTYEACQCKWRNIYAGYEFIDHVLRG